jgi:hypothetical protein
MRGTPNHLVKCEKCGAPDGFPNCKLCRRCRPPEVRQKYFFTPELDAWIRRVYADNHDRDSLGEGITALAKRMGCPRYIVYNRAARLGIRMFGGDRWTSDEIAYLRNHAGIKSIAAMRRELRRSFTSIKSKMEAMHLSRRITEGYSRAELKELFGISGLLVARWVSKGWIVADEESDRVTEESVVRFLKTHPEEYSLKRIDEAWFKGLIFPAFGCMRHRLGNAPSRNPYQEIA